MDKAIRTTCPYCGVGCGIVATVEEGRAPRLHGDPDHPANKGKLCVKGMALGETLDLEGRLLSPQIRGKEVSWDQALDHVAHKFIETKKKFGSDSIAFYVSGQLLTEDYYVANKLMKGFIGSSNIDSNSRLCMSSSVAGHIRAFGSDTVPGSYEDLEVADLVVLVGSNAAWCHPILFQRLQAAKAKRPTMKIVVIDPRKTSTCEGADLHLAIKAGSDVALFNGLLLFLKQKNKIDKKFVKNHTLNLIDTLKAATQDSDVSKICDIDEDDMMRFYQWFSQYDKTVTVYSQGVNQSNSGTDKVNAIINCHLLTGRIGKPGMGPLSFTGQPNAMGGREVGGLSSTLAAHMGFDCKSIDRVKRFWKSPEMAQQSGLKAVDMFQALHSGQIKAIWIMATNPVVSMPDSHFIQESLEKCPFVVISDAMQVTDTTAFADVLLPSLAWAEKSGTVTNSERCISRQAPFLPAPGEAKADWWIISEIAKKMGYGEAFDYQGPHDIFREHCQLSSFENEGLRDFDLTGLIDSDYDHLSPIQWPVKESKRGTKRLFGEGHFYHNDYKARFIPVSMKEPQSQISPLYPFILNTGRTRDHWHTMTRTGKSPTLMNHRSEPWLAIHPDDAKIKGWQEESLVQIENPLGHVALKLVFDKGQRRGDVFAPIHWSQQFASSASIGQLIASHRDPLSGQPELKFSPVKIQPIQLIWKGVLFNRQDMSLSQKGLYWSKARRKACSVTYVYSTFAVDDWIEWLSTIFSEKRQWIHYHDRAVGDFRSLSIKDNRLESVFFSSLSGFIPSPDIIEKTFLRDKVDSHDYVNVLSGQVIEKDNKNPIICSCFNLKQDRIIQAIDDKKLMSPKAIGDHLKAGTNCGSCIPDLQRLILEKNQHESVV